MNVLKRFYSPLPRVKASRHLRRENIQRTGDDGTQRIANDSIQRIRDEYYDSSITSSLLSNDVLIIERQIEMMNVFLGFEQANRYVIMNELGERVGFMEERDIGLLKVIMRQIYRLHRPFTVDVFDVDGAKVMSIERKFSFINSHIKAINNYGRIIGESVQRWHLWRRCYELFLKSSSSSSSSEPQQDDGEYVQFGVIDSGFLAFEFPVYNERGAVESSISRKWVGLGREVFTDSGIYSVDFGRGTPVDKKAVLLSAAVSIDFDYFSRHSTSSINTVD